MRIAVLTSPDSWYLKDLRRAAGRQFDLSPCAFDRLTAHVGVSGGPAVSDAQRDLSAMDGVLVRTMPPGTLEQVVFRMNVLARLEQLGTRVLNPPRALEVAIDKYLALTRIADAGLRVPPTITCQTWRDAMTAFDDLGGDVVVKPIFGGEGRGIARVDDESFALRAFKMLEQLGCAIYLQQYIAHDGCDLRLLVVGDDVLAMRRRNPGDWRTNVSRGAVTERIVVDPSLARLARAAAAAVGTPLAGVDLLPSRDGDLYVLEVNAVPGWRALAKTVRLDVARLVLEFMRRWISELSVPNDSFAENNASHSLKPMTKDCGPNDDH